MKPLIPAPQRLFALALAPLLMTTLLACSTPDGDATEGKRWYEMNNCSSCHGPNGNDGRSPDIANIDMSFRSFLKKLRTMDAPIMPGFPEEKLSKADAADIYIFLKSVK